MNMRDDVHICALLRHFKSDIEYLHFGDFWVQKLTEEDRKQFCTDLKYFNNYWDDYYIAAENHHIGRGEFDDFLSRRVRVFWFPLFRLMKLFKRGDLIIPFCFTYVYKKSREMRFHGDSYALGCWLLKDAEPYFLEKKDIEPFNTFRKEIGQYLKYIDISDSPYRKYKTMSDIDTRCILAIHILLKGSMEHHNPFLIIDTLIDYTIALESLYLLRGEDKRQNLSSRIAALLGKDEREQEQISHIIKKLYDIRSDIVHGSLMDREGDEFLRANIYEYGDYLRKSILAFLDLNLRDPSKKVVLGVIDKAILDTDLRREIQGSLKVLRLAR
jgi:hypothetical protein